MTVVNDLLSGDVDKLDRRRRRWDFLALLEEALNVQIDCFLNQAQNFGLGVPHRHTARQIGHIGPKGSGSTFNYNNVSHAPILLESCLFEDSVQSALRNIYAWLPGNRDRTRFRRVSKLTVTSLHPNLQPAIN
jgi:hypothetical protein